MIIVYMARGTDELRFSPKHLSLDIDSVKGILLIGIPSGIQTTLFSLSNVLIQSSVNSFGELAMAGNSASANLESFIHTAMVSIYHAALAFVGQNMGAKRYENIKRLAFNCIAIVSVIGIVISAVIFLFRNPLLSLYTDSDEVVKWATYRMLFMLPVYPLCGIMDVTSATLRSMGRSVTAMINALVGACAFRIVWVSVIFNFVARDIGWIYAAFGISYVIGIVLNSTFIVSQYRSLKKGIKDTV
jgi:Na+-driven multidrug efflux pump